MRLSVRELQGCIKVSEGGAGVNKMSVFGLPKRGRIKFCEGLLTFTRLLTSNFRICIIHDAEIFPVVQSEVLNPTNTPLTDKVGQT